MRSPIAWIALLSLGFAPAWAQEPVPTPKPEPTKETPAEEDTTLEEETPDVPMPIPSAAEDAATKEILELFKKVDQSLSEIDNMLFDIGAGERPLEAPEDSGLGQLLDLTRKTSEAVVNDIDRILELAEQMAQQQQSSSSSGSGEKQQQPQGGKNQQGQSQPEDSQQGQEKKPEEGGEKKPDQQGEKPEGEQPQDPNQPNESDQEAQNKPQEGDQQHPLGAGSQADATERWGELPERVRETFRNQGGEDAPLYYRDWIDSYYRHLSRKDG